MVEFIYTLIVTVLAGIICHIVCKWLDGGK